MKAVQGRLLLDFPGNTVSQIKTEVSQIKRGSNKYKSQTITVIRQTRLTYFFIFSSHLMSETASPLRRLTKVSEKAKMKPSISKNLQMKANASVESVSMSP